MVASWKCRILLLLHAGLHGLALAEKCQLPGQCLGGVLLGLSFTDSLDACIIKGGQLEDAKFVTWKPLTPGLCQVFSFCETVNNTEVEAITSSLDCKVEGTKGACSGQITTENVVPGREECGQLCLNTPTCAWFTYLEEQQYCLIFADCSSLTTDCTNCYTSMKTCLQDSSTTLPPTSTQTTSTSTPAPPAINKLLFIDGKSGRTTLVSLDGTSENCALEDYPANSNFPAAVTYSAKDGAVLACGGRYLEDADRCWSFNGSTWSALPNSGQRHCWADSSNVMVEDGWWVTGLQQTEDGCNRYSSSTSEIFTGEEWIPGPGLPGDGSYPDQSCVVNLNTTHTMLVGGRQGINYLNDVWLYTWRNQQWTRTGSLNQGRNMHGCVSLGDQGVLAVGGDDGSSGVYTVEQYDPALGTWSLQPNLPRDIDTIWLNPVIPIILNHNNQILGLFSGENQIYQRSEENGEWSVLVNLPETFRSSESDKAVLVPNNFAQCN